MHHELLPFKTIKEVLEENSRNVELIGSLKSKLNSTKKSLSGVNNKLTELEVELDLTNTKLVSKNNKLQQKEKIITSLQNDKSRMARQIDSQSNTISDQVKAIDVANREASRQNDRNSDLSHENYRLRNSKLLVIIAYIFHFINEWH